MATIPLSDGTTLTVPDDVSDADAQRYYEEAEAAIKAEADNGTDPVPVDDSGGGNGIGAKVGNWLSSWTPEGEKFPGYTVGHEALSGAISTLSDVPNWPVHLVNNARELADLHFGSGTGNVEPIAPFIGPGGVITEYSLKEPFDKLNPPTPGWENFRADAGMGAAAGVITRNPMAALAVPLANEVTSRIGRQIDEYQGNENHKWERTLPAVVPFASRGAGAVGRKLNPMTVASAVQQVGGYDAAGAAYLGTQALKSTLKGADAIGVPKPGIGELVARGVLPYAIDNGRERW